MYYKIVIDLKTEEDLLGNFAEIPIIGVNQMYTGGISKGRKGKRSTKELIMYKNFLKEKIDEFRKKNKWKEDFDITTPVFYTVVFDLKVPMTKNGEINKKYLRDVDNLIKPLQDSLESQILKDGTKIRRIFNNDKIIQGFLATIKYNELPYSRITINIFDYNPEKINKLFNTTKKLLKK